MKEIPKFKTEDEERKFWEKNDTTSFVDWSNAKNVILPNIQKTTRSVSLNLPIDLIERIKVQAYKINIPYHALIKLYISKQLTEEVKVN